MNKDRVLISTIVPINGGVPQMTRFIINCIKEMGKTPVLAYYEPYSISPELSVPVYRLLQRNVSHIKTENYNQVESYAIGAWLPELEFTHYLPTKIWLDVMESCQYHIAVSGNVLPAAPFYFRRRNFAAWVATPWMEDREDRIKSFPFSRKILDRFINKNIIEIFEKKILLSGTILALSNYTKEKILNLSNNKAKVSLLRMPIDLARFKTDEQRAIKGKIGFTGRFNDPRKNINLLFNAAKICKENGTKISIEIIGEKADDKLLDLLRTFNLNENTNIVPHINNNELPAYLQSFDLFVIPSHQEGLCISALEAMACGCPVISTHCGGPEEYVVDNETGFLVSFNPEQMAKTIMEIITNRNLRFSLSQGARRKVEKSYSDTEAKKIFTESFNKTFIN